MMPDFLSLQSDHQHSLSELISQSHLTVWRAGAKIEESGDFLVLGVGTYCLYDLRLLNQLNAFMSEGRVSGVRVSVFDWSDLRPDVLVPDVPDLGEPHHTPLAALWVNGKLVEVNWGYPARRFICERYGLPLDEISRRPSYLS